MQTTFFTNKANMPSKRLDRCHDGDGAIHWIGVLNGEAPGGERLRFIHDDVLPPGASIGVHRHTNDQEYDYIHRQHCRGCRMTLDFQQRRREIRIKAAF